jgi:two-component system response regulator DctR
MSARRAFTRDAADVDHWRVMIVEDNGAVAALHKRIVDSSPYFHTAHIARNGVQAFDALPAVNPDLVILDLTMPGGDGLPFLRRLRGGNVPVDVVVVTASRSGRVVQEATQLGVLDYLVKPFAPPRLRHALSVFAVRHRTLMSFPELSQGQVDSVRAAATTRQRRALPGGLRQSTLAAVLNALGDAPDGVSAEQLGCKVGIARVTARRYLAYLEIQGIVEVNRESHGPGRPRNRYRLMSSAE